ncbi:hypothetical protein E3O19_04430 [Cryobacterium algoritolerans]|uniref:YqaJ viral recombinase domain-containing protein n=1 Tax=Cryobacterium algoritolerans TaxID=1259184 RepID=A0A4R8X0L5_9MICO|nr:YqaJ viral recombinase family protein [Cryobacterium algoritolerans]TFC18618.1 hypothetical protein E3O19_04430 [Cryobacterium algoritolerans]
MTQLESDLPPRRDLQPRISGRSSPRFTLSDDGEPIDSQDRAQWLLRRRSGVTATDVNRLVLTNGNRSAQWHNVLREKLTGDGGYWSPSFQHGIDREPVIAAWVQENFAITPNTRLFQGENPRHLATPDGIGEREVCEIKTSSFLLSATLNTYRDQMQWQMHVTGAERCLFVVEDRDSLTIEHRWVDRDTTRIGMLVERADEFLQELDSALSGQASPAGFIYGIGCRCHPDAGVRYIGKTDTTVARRFAQHTMAAASGGSVPLYHWMRAHGKENIYVVELEAVDQGTRILTRESRWIETLRGQGADLLNVGNNWTRGADGIRREWEPRDLARFAAGSWPRFARASDGNPMDARHRKEWLFAGMNGVTERDAAEMLSPSLRASLLQQKLRSLSGGPTPLTGDVDVNRLIPTWAKAEHGIVANAMLCSGENPRHVATPDGIGERVICEVMTSAVSIDALLKAHASRLQWQLHVTSAESLLFLVHYSYPTVEHIWVFRDESHIQNLAAAANSFLQDLDLHAAKSGTE